MVFPRILTSFSRSYSSGSGSIFKSPSPNDRREEVRSSSPSSSTSTIQPLKRNEESEDITPTDAYTPRDYSAASKPEEREAKKESENADGWSYGPESDNSDISTLDLGPSITTSPATPKASTPLATHPEYPLTPLPGSESQDDPFDQVKPLEREPDSKSAVGPEESNQRVNNVPAHREEQAETPVRPPKRKSDTVVATFRTLSSSGSSLFAGLRPGVNRARTSFRRGGVLND
ncbi:hypothetical protein P170DRAFT_422391 [Aspergillus steynii IBT 23096]|uniref:Uncharacterized protein n=1 Tax=Aspergillus steynii IBT 23096 TaxID=1392250 RepID=A0A2I2GSP9_9EURO|nr:uncharacterized protein P170DRAFT_422391 [Aspergillus steynii IBT 23096]PLB55902.1 hypothetical protein P170DRAFT_422391 [Aspergillus steynii IBT 23096]